MLIILLSLDLWGGAAGGAKAVNNRLCCQLLAGNGVYDEMPRAYYCPQNNDHFIINCVTFTFAIISNGVNDGANMDV